MRSSRSGVAYCPASSIISSGLGRPRDALHLKASWTKGGKERDVPIATAQQRQVLDDAKVLAGLGSLIPATLSYRDQLTL